MNMEGLPHSSNESAPEPSQQTPERLLVAVELLLKTKISKLEVAGKEHLEEVKPDENPIIATSHIEDIDIPLAAAVFGRLKTSSGRLFNVAITDQSVHHTFAGEPSTYLGLRAAGQDNFIPIDWKKDVDGKTPRFNPDNFSPMKTAMENGKTIIIAAQNPTFTGELGKGAVGAIYLAQLTGQPIVPFAVDMAKKQGLLKRPIANTKIGSPIRLSHIEGIEQLASLEAKRKIRTMTDQEKQQYRSLIAALKEQSEIVMRAIATMLPEEKRGIYGEKP